MKSTNPKSHLRHRIDNVVSVRHFERLVGMPCDAIDEIAKKAGRYYQPFDKRRHASDPKWRHIDNPVGRLREIQDRLQKRIFSRIDFPAGMHGGVKGRSLVDNARPHTRSPEIVRIDLANCFPNIRPRQVYDALRRLGWSAEMASKVTRLTTYQQRLPQGAPTSSSLANLVLMPLYDEICEIAEGHDAAVTFWVDDIILSGDHPQRAVEDVIKAINRNGHRTSRRKIDILRHHVCAQRVTGVVVNAGLSAGRARLRGIRNTIRQLADSPVAPTDKQLKSIDGRIGAVDQINPRQGAVLEKLRNDLLPQSGLPGKEEYVDLYRPCRNAARHRQ